MAAQPISFRFNKKLWDRFCKIAEENDIDKKEWLESKILEFTEQIDGDIGIGEGFHLTPYWKSSLYSDTEFIRTYIYKVKKCIEFLKVTDEKILLYRSWCPSLNALSDILINSNFEIVNNTELLWEESYCDEFKDLIRQGNKSSLKEVQLKYNYLHKLITQSDNYEFDENTNTIKGKITNKPSIAQLIGELICVQAGDVVQSYSWSSHDDLNEMIAVLGLDGEYLLKNCEVFDKTIHSIYDLQWIFAEKDE